MSDDLSGDMLAPSWPNLVGFDTTDFIFMACDKKASLNYTFGSVFLPVNAHAVVNILNLT